MAPIKDSDDSLITEKGSCRAPRFRLKECRQTCVVEVIRDRNAMSA